MTVGMGCKSLEVQTPGNRQFSYLAGAFLQVILFFRLDKRDELNRSPSGAPGVLRRVREAYPRLALSHYGDPGPLRPGPGDGRLRPVAQGEGGVGPVGEYLVAVNGKGSYTVGGSAAAKAILEDLERLNLISSFKDDGEGNYRVHAKRKKE